jgi:hypothetical protein
VHDVEVYDVSPKAGALLALPTVNSLVQWYHILARSAKIFVDIAFESVHRFTSL